MIYLDCSSGAAGDMLASALIGLGADPEKIKKVLKGVAQVRVGKTGRGKVRAVRFDVVFKPKSGEIKDLVKLVKGMRLKPKVEALALRVLRILAEAESQVHGVPAENAHLHEAADCVVDAVACALALDDLGLMDDVFVSSVISAGFIAPATMRILAEYGIPVRFVSDKELLTPTGAALLAALVSEYRQMGYGPSAAGAGKMRLPWPNVLKVAKVSPKVVLESNIDDCTPEHVSHMVSSLMAAGALDVHVIPCIMKKGRIGFLVRVLSEKPRNHAKIIMAETGSLGVRVIPVESRFELPRKLTAVDVSFGMGKMKVRVKWSPLGYKPEFDDVSGAAKKYGLTFREARKRVECALSRRKDTSKEGGVPSDGWLSQVS